MKKLLSICLILVLVVAMFLSAMAHALTNSELDSAIGEAAAAALEEREEEARRFTYKDGETGLTFTVPAGWARAPLAADGEDLSVQYMPTNGDTAVISYAVLDLWGEMDAADKQQITRAEANDNVFSIDGVADILGISPNDIETVSYGGQKYYKYILNLTTTNNDVDYSFDVTQWFRIGNGYLYLFQFYCDDNESNYYDYYSDFLFVIKSAKYVEEKVAATAGSNESSTTSTKEDTSFKLDKSSIFIVIIIIFAVLGLFKLLTGRSKEKPVEDAMPKNTSERIKPQLMVEELPEEPEEERKIPKISEVNFCYKCGNKLPSGSVFCNKCGTKVIY